MVHKLLFNIEEKTKKINFIAPSYELFFNYIVIYMYLLMYIKLKKMKSIFNSGVIFALFAVMAISCTDSEDILNDEVATRATGTSLIMSSPTEINFSDAVVGQTYKQEVTIVSAGLTPLTVLTAFDIIVQGADADQFNVELPSLSLIGIVEALLGQGYTFTVTYTPTAVGTSNATVLVNASLLGVLLPTQLEIPATGTTATGPQLVSGGEMAQFVGYDPEDPTRALFEIILTFDRDITLANSSAVNGPVPGFFKRVITRANKLVAQASILVSEIQNFTGEIILDVEALLDGNGDPLLEDIIFDFILGDIL